MSNWIEGQPDWCDNRKPAEVEWNDGRRLTGRLHTDDDPLNGDLPTFFLLTSAGKKPLDERARFRLL